MSAIGRVTVEGASLDCALIQFPDGFPWVELIREVEPITAMGVTGTRLRVTREDYRRWRMKTFTEYATYESAVDAASLVRQYRGKLGYLLVTAGGTYWDLSDSRFYVLEVQAVARAGQLVGPNVVITNPLAFIEADWVLQCIESPS